MVKDWDEKQKAWNEIAKEIINDVKSGLDVAFITLGDPMVYSTYSYLLERIADHVETETIPGISSFSQISNHLQIPLVIDEESYAVLPATAEETILQMALEQLSTVVLMKVSIALPKVLKILTRLDLLEQTILVSDSSMESEKIVIGLSELNAEDDLSYFSTMIIYKNRTLKG